MPCSSPVMNVIDIVVVVLKDGLAVLRLAPKAVSRICSLFLRRGGKTTLAK